MIRRAPAGPWLAAAALLISGAAAGAEPEQAQELLEDGMELVVVSVPGASTSSVRMIIRAGGSNDLQGKSGTAFLLARAIGNGIIDARGTRLRELVERAGGTFTVETGSTHTVFGVDAPSAEIARLAAALVANVSSPALLRVDLDRELPLANSELEPGGQRGVWLRLERLLFPPADPNAPVQGTPISRKQLGTEDLIAFFNRNYLTSFTTVVFTGAITPAQAKEILDRNVLLPPALPDERPAAPRVDPVSLPLTEKSPDDPTLALIGYRVEKGRRRACRTLARVLDRPVTLALLKSRKAPDARVRCLTLRGVDFLLAEMPVRHPDTYQLPEVVGRAFKAGARAPPRSKDWDQIAAGAALEMEMLLEDAPALADAIAAEAAQPRTQGLTDLGMIFAEPQLAWGQIKDLARRSFREDRMLQLYLSP